MDIILARSRSGRLVALLAAVVLTAAALLTASPASASHDVTAARAGGADRFATAVAISEITFPSGAEIAYVARADEFADALAAAPLAGQAPSGPILLTNSDDVPSTTMGELRRLGLRQVVLLGGTRAISRRVEQELAAEFERVRRISGATRYATAAAVAREIAEGGGVRTVEGRRTAFLASGENFPDALAAGAPAAAGTTPTPVLLTQRDRLAAEASSAITDLGVQQILLVGGEAAVGNAVAQQLRDRGIVVRRLSGPTRLATAVAVAEYAFGAFGLTSERVVLTRGDAFPDALAAAPHAGSIGAPILLAGGPSVLGDESRAWFHDACLGIRVVRAVGGTGAVSESVLAAAVDAAEDCHGTWGLLPPAPVAPRHNHSAVWSGDRMLIWGGADAAPAGGDVVHADGAAWSPARREWRALPNAPIEPRWAHAAAWTGDRMLVWGGSEGPDHLADCFPDGALYDPATGTWQAIPAAPTGPRCGAATAWTGTEFLVHGGAPGGGPQDPLGDGAAYNPTTGTWRGIPPAPVSPRAGHTSAWTGQELLVYGGSPPGYGDPLGDAAAYNPTTDTWRTLPPPPMPARHGAAGAWTGSEWLVFGGSIGPEQRRDGAAYAPTTDTWRSLPTLPAPVGTPEAVRAGDVVYVVGGGSDNGTTTAAFLAYRPATDAWEVLPDPPQGARGRHEVVWTGDRLIVWGGLTADGQPARGVVWRP